MGVAVGPGKQSHSWDAALSKHQQRDSSWGSHHLGLNFSAAVYSTYVVTVLSHIWQLEELPDNFAVIEMQELSSLACPGKLGPARRPLLPQGAVRPGHIFRRRTPCFIDSAYPRARMDANGGLRAKQRAIQLDACFSLSLFFVRKAR